jgi:hypothetical protein
MLSDPLFLVDGNDRKAAHYARWTVSTIREQARNPFHIKWGDAIEQLTVRFGWEIAWQRSLDRLSVRAGENVIGRKHPERRDYMPSGAALASPGQGRRTRTYSRTGGSLGACTRLLMLRNYFRWKGRWRSFREGIA